MLLGMRDFLNLISVVGRKIGTVARLVRESGIRGLLRYASRRFKYPILRVAVQLAPGKAHLKRPHTIQIEASSRCNLRCPSCSLSRELGPGRNISVDELGRILDGLPFVPSAISLNGIGEPLVNPAFFGLVDLLAERGIDCSFYTNGSLLDETRRRRIVERANVAFVGISCDSADPERFERLRYGARYERWTADVGAFVNMARARSARPIGLVMSVVVSGENVDELEAIVRLAASLQFPAVQFSELVPHDEEAQAMALDSARLAGLERSALARLGGKLGVEVGFAGLRAVKDRRLNCFQPWEYAQITAEGDVLPCCVIVGSVQAPIMGNIHATPFDLIWRGSTFRTFRDGSARGTEPICARCPYH